MIIIIIFIIMSTIIRGALLPLRGEEGCLPQAGARSACHGRNNDDKKKVIMMILILLIVILVMTLIIIMMMMIMIIHKL